MALYIYSFGPMRIFSMMLIRVKLLSQRYKLLYLDRFSKMSSKETFSVYIPTHPNMHWIIFVGTEGQLYFHLIFSGHRWNKMRFIYCDLDVDFNMGSSFPACEC